MEICIDANTKDLLTAEKRCPKGYHIEFTRRGNILFVRDGYHYDMSDDFCYKDSN